MTECSIKPCYVIELDDRITLVGYIIRVEGHIEDYTVYPEYHMAYEYAIEKGYKIR